VERRRVPVPDFLMGSAEVFVGEKHTAEGENSVALCMLNSGNSYHLCREGKGKGGGRRRQRQEGRGGKKSLYLY